MVVSPRVITMLLTALTVYLVLLLSLGSRTVNTNTAMADCRGFITRQTSNCLGMRVTLRIGVVVDRTTRVGREQEVAIRMGVDDINKSVLSDARECSNRYELELYVVDSKGSAARAASAAIKLIYGMKVDTLVGAITLPLAALITENNEDSQRIPFLLLTPTAMGPPLLQPQPQSLIQVAHDISTHMKCISAVIGQFKWRKVTVIYEQQPFALSTGIVTLLSDSLKAVGATVEHHMAFKPPNSPGWNPDIDMDKGLHELRSNNNRIFIVVQSSIELAVHLFPKAKHMGMMEKGYVWIVSDEIASLIDSLHPSVTASMQGVIGCKTNVNGISSSIRPFNHKFQKNYLAANPNEEDSSPSIFSLRAYDSVWAIANVLKTQQEGLNSRNRLLPELISTSFSGLSGMISFQNGALWERPAFCIINMVGKSYNELAIWSPSEGFLKKLPKSDNLTGKVIESIHETVEYGPVFWPGGHHGVPPGWGSGGAKDVLKIGVPGDSVKDYINVNYDQHLNRIEVTGFSIEVFKASLTYLPYHFPYVLISVNCSYDDLVRKIDLKELDGVVGDTSIMADRYPWAEFTQPYMKSGLSLVVPVKGDATNEAWKFMEAFETKMWIIIPATSLFIGFVVWLIEHGDNPDFKSNTISQQVGTIFWFSFEVLFFAQNESIKHNLSKIVLTPWFVLIMIITASFTASLTSNLTVSQLQPSARDIDTLRRENAVIGCYSRSYIYRHLVNIFRIKPVNLRDISSIDDYSKEFEAGNIQAAVFATHHANIFLAKYCRRYMMAGHIYTNGGLGFAFPKGSPLALDFSAAIIQAIEKEDVHRLEKDMLSSYDCSDEEITPTGLGFGPVSGLFYISGGTAVVALLVTVISKRQPKTM